MYDFNMAMGMMLSAVFATALLSAVFWTQKTRRKGNSKHSTNSKNRRRG